MQTGNIKVSGARLICVNLLLGADFDVAARLGLGRLLVVGEAEVSSARFDVLLSKDLNPSTPGALDESLRLPQQSSDEPLPI